MDNDLQVINYQKTGLYLENNSKIEFILANSKAPITDIFNLGVMIGKREERKKKYKHTDNENSLLELCKKCIIARLKDVKDIKTIEFILRYVEQSIK